MIRVYLAGPYSKPDPCINTHNAIRTADELLALGYIPYVPHLTHFWHTVSPKPYRSWLDYDSAWLQVCDVVLRLPGDSSGADEEVALAKKIGRPIVESISELRERFRLPLGQEQHTGRISG